MIICFYFNVTILIFIFLKHSPVIVFFKKKQTISKIHILNPLLKFLICKNNLKLKNRLINYGLNKNSEIK